MFAYSRQHGHYPAVVCADQIYRTHSNRAFRAHHNIRLSGPSHGKPKSDPYDLVVEEKRQFKDDQRRRNPAVEGNFGQGIRRFGVVRRP